MKMFLQSKDLWEVIVEERPQEAGEEPIEPNEAGGEEVVVAARQAAHAETLRRHQERVRVSNEWRRRDGKAMNFIALGVDRSNANLIYNLDSGAEAWRVLKAYHMVSSLGNKLRTKKKLYSMKIQVGGSMREHLNEMTELFNKVAEIDGPVPEDQKVTTILSSVEPEYEALTTAIMAWSDERLSVQGVKDRLIEEWEKKKEMAAAKDKEVAFAGEEKPKPTFSCYGCKMPGHIRRNCPLAKEQDLRTKLNKIRANKAAETGQDYTNCLFNELGTINGWIIDSGASSHMTPKKNLFSEINTNHRSDVIVANGQVVESKGIGNVYINVKAGTNGFTTLKLSNVLWVPDLDGNLFSVRKFANEGNTIKFDHECVYLERGDETQKIGTMKRNHYQLNEKEFCMKINDKAAEEDSACVHQWHRRMAHRNLNDIRLMGRQGLKIRKCSCSDDCEDCMIGKMSRKPFPKKSQPTEEVLDCVVSDVCGYFQVETLNRKRYFVTFTDVCSRYCEVILIREKSEVADVTIQYIERMKTQFGRKPKIFRSDRGTEFTVEKLQLYLRNEGIKFECTVGYAPEQNGIAERKNRTLMEAARCMLSESGLPKTFWGEAVNMANYVTNRMITRATMKTPFEAMFGKEPRWEQLRQFGCEAFVMIPQEKRRKLDDKSEKMKFVGYDTQSKGYRMTDGKKVIISREVHFLSNATKTPTESEDLQPEGTLDLAILEEDENLEEKVQEEQEEDVEIMSENGNSEIGEDVFESAEEGEANESEIDELEVEEQDPVPRRSARRNFGVPPAYLQDYARQADDSRDPKTYKEAINSENAEEWQEAIREELQSIEQNETWELADLPKHRKAIGSKYVFKTKTDSNGAVIRRKARLVAQGFSQKYGVDYDEVFAPVARSTTFRMLMSIAGARKYLVKQFDIKTAFLNGTLTEEIYLKPPPGSETKGKFYRLKKSLYGLKQSARVWNQTLHESLVKNGCEQNKTDNCLYSLTSGEDVVHLLIHVDDIVAATNNLKRLNDLMSSIGKDFELKDLGEVKDFLGIMTQRDKEGNYYISQPDYIAKIIEAAKLTEGKSSKFPMDTGYHKLEGKELPSNEHYRKIVGMLLYLSTNSRPDIAASVAILSQRVKNPRDVDLNEAKRVVRYLKGTQHEKLRLSSSSNHEMLFAYSDSDWAENKFDRKSHSGFFCSMNGGTIGWSCKKQDLVALSSAEAEYVALSEASKEVIWTTRIAKHFGVELQAPVSMYTDSQSAMAMIINQKFSHRTKHIDTKYHFIKDIISKGIIELKYHPTATNVADMMTKPLGGNKMLELRRLAGMETGGLHNRPIEEKC